MLLPFHSDTSPLLLFLLLVRIAPLYLCSFCFTDEVSQLLRHPGPEVQQKPSFTAWYPEHHTSLPGSKATLSIINTSDLYLSKLQSHRTFYYWTHLFYVHQRPIENRHQNYHIGQVSVSNPLPDPTIPRRQAITTHRLPVH